MTDEPSAENTPTGDAAPAAGSEPRAPRRAADMIARTDASPAPVKAARAARSLIPDAPSLPGGRRSDRVAELITSSRPDQPSVLRELGLGAVAMWQALVSRRPSRTDQPIPATILFTDLVGFSTWALAAGDDQVLKLLAQVNTATESVVTARGGSIVKHLGDGTMAVFVDGTEAIEAAYEAICAVSALTVDGYRPQLRAGLHTGAPRAVGDDFLGVDVNIAARVADAAGAGELLVSDATLAAADPGRYHRRRRRFKAKGVPRDLEVFAVVPRYDD